MKYILPILSFTVFVAVAHSAYASGSIGWEDVKKLVNKSDVEIIKIIEKNFIVDAVGSGVRLGNRFGDRVGERISPYRFEATQRNTADRYFLEIAESSDFEFSGRYQFSLRIIKEKQNEQSTPTNGSGGSSTQ
jgi:hypothetical protein